MTLKRTQVVEQIRQDIVSGRIAPGGRLPSHRELAANLGVAGVTIQSALRQLEREGFIDARDRSGLYVTENPPHLHQYGLVFWNDPSAPFGNLNWSRYFQALTLAAADFERATGKRVLQFHGVDWHTDSSDRARLIQHLESQRLAGIVFANIPFFLAGSPILDLPGIPRLAIESESQDPNVRAVTFNGRQWLDKAVVYLASRNRKRVAVIANAVSAPNGVLDGQTDQLRHELSERGMTTCNRWMQFANMLLPQGARQIAELLMADRERPDALLIMDDNYVEPALAGLASAGVKVPDDIAVVGHANFPLPPAKTLPARLLGYDQRTMLRTAVEVIDRWRAGEKPPDAVTLPALWEEEAVDAAPPTRGAGRG